MEYDGISISETSIIVSENSWWIQGFLVKNKN